MSDAEDFATLFARESARAVLEIGQIVKRARHPDLGRERVRRCRRQGRGLDRARRAHRRRRQASRGHRRRGRGHGGIDRGRNPALAQASPGCAGPAGARRRGPDRHSRRGQGGRRHQGRLRGHGRRPARVLSVLSNGRAARRGRGRVRRARPRVPRDDLQRERAQSQCSRAAACSRSGSAEMAEETRKKIIRAPCWRARWPRSRTSARSSTWAVCRGSCRSPSCLIRERAGPRISCAWATPCPSRCSGSIRRRGGSRSA